jgi:hypothetical protein
MDLKKELAVCFCQHFRNINFRSTSKVFGYPEIPYFTNQRYIHVAGETEGKVELFLVKGHF